MKKHIIPDISLSQAWCLPGETWKDIPGFEGMYQVSNMGRVRGLNRVDSGGYRRKARVMKQTQAPRGNVNVALSKRADSRLYQVHRLAMLAFVGPCPDGNTVNHKDGNRANNAISNLEYLPHKLNVHHAIDVLGHEMGAKGERNGRSTLNVHTVREIRRLHREKGMQGTAIAKKLKLGVSAVRHVLKGRVWTHVE